MIVVTGASGNVGEEVVRQLAAKGIKTRALVRDPKKVQLPASVEVVQADLDQPETLSRALEGAEKMFLLATGLSILTHEANATKAAKAAGVKHIVKLSVFGAQYGPFSFARWHNPAEKALVEAGVPWTILRPNGFMSNMFGWAGSIKGQGAFYFCAGEGGLSVIDPRDIAAVAVHVLTTSGHEGKAYDLTGPKALSMAEQAKILSEVLGKTVQYVNVPDEAVKTSLLQYGMPEPLVDATVELGVAIRNNQAGAVTDTVQTLLGRAPRTFEAWAKENAAAFR